MAKRWKIFTVLTIMFMVGFFYRVSMSVISRQFSADLGLTAAQLGVVSAVFFYAFAIAQIPLGPVIDRYGGRPVLTVFGVVTACGSVIFALAPAYPAALIGRALLGLGTACVLMGSLKIFTNWFTVEEFPRISGYIIGAGNIGSLGATAPLAIAVSAFTWRPTFVAMAAAQALATLLVFLVARDAPEGNADPSAAARGSSGEAGTVLGVWKLLLKSVDFWLISLTAFFWYANYMVLLSLWGGPYLREAVGLGDSRAGFTLLFTSVGYIAGSLVVGKVIEWLGDSLEKTLLLGQTSLVAAMTFMLGPADHLAGPLLDAVFFLVGLVSASGVMIYPLARRLVPPHAAATAMTCVNFFLLMGAASMQHIMGHYICSFPRSACGYPATAYHGAFLIPISGLACSLVLFYLRKAAKGFDSPRARITENGMRPELSPVEERS